MKTPQEETLDLPDGLSFRQQATAYALARRVPEMSRGFTIVTSYGDIVIHHDEAAAIQKAVEDVLQKRMAVQA